jgi:hypothetical protein
MKAQKAEEFLFGGSADVCVQDRVTRSVSLCAERQRMFSGIANDFAISGKTEYDPGWFGSYLPAPDFVSENHSLGGTTSAAWSL